MGTFNHPIEIADLNSRHSRRIEATVNTGVFFSIAPSPLLRELGIEPTEKTRMRMPDGTQRDLDIGYCWVTIQERRSITIVAFGDDSERLLLGKYTLNGLALAPDPDGHRFVSLEPLPLYSVPPTTLRTHDRRSVGVVP